MRIIGFFVVFLFLLSCQQGTPSAHYADGGMRIVSLAPSITKDLVQLGMSSAIVGATSYCDITQQNKELIVGSAIDVNVEKVLLLRPSIVFTTPLTNQQTIQTLKKSGIVVVVLPKVTSFQQICAQLKQVGRQVNKEHLAIHLVDSSVRLIDSLKASLPDFKQKKKVFFQVGSNPVFAVVPGTFMNDFITMAKADNIATNRKNPSVTREFVLTKNPDVLFIATMGGFEEQEKDIWSGYPQLKAAKNNQIVLVDANMVCLPALSSFVESFVTLLPYMR